MQRSDQIRIVLEFADDDARLRKIILTLRVKRVDVFSDVIDED